MTTPLNPIPTVEDELDAARAAGELLAARFDADELAVLTRTLDTAKAAASYDDALVIDDLACIIRHAEVVRGEADTAETDEGWRTVVSRRRQRTGTIVEIIDNRDGSFEATDVPFEAIAMRWVTLCEHGNYVLHATRELAHSHACEPDGWCDECRDARDRRKAR